MSFKFEQPQTFRARDATDRYSMHILHGSNELILNRIVTSRVRE